MGNDETKKTCCFSGHRPEKLTVSENVIRSRLSEAVKTAADKGYCNFISGMARGFDIWAAEAVLTAGLKNPSIRLICAVPHPGFEKRRTFYERSAYRKIIDRADEVHFVCEHYFAGCYQIRNCWMVDRSSLVIAGYSGIPSGTRNTILYAGERSVPVINILN